MSSKQTMKNQLKEMLHALSEDEFQVNGWNFTIDDDTKFNPFCLESASKAGFPHRFGMPEIHDMFYVSEEYQTYLNALAESGKEHPANTDGKPSVEEVLDDALQTT